MSPILSNDIIYGLESKLDVVQLITTRHQQKQLAVRVGCVAKQSAIHTSQSGKRCTGMLAGRVA